MKPNETTSNFMDMVSTFCLAVAVFFGLLYLDVWSLLMIVLLGLGFGVLVVGTFIYFGKGD